MNYVSLHQTYVYFFTCCTHTHTDTHTLSLSLPLSFSTLFMTKNTTIVGTNMNTECGFEFGVTYHLPILHDPEQAR